MVRLRAARSLWVGLAGVVVFAFTGSLANANVAPQKIFYLQLKVGQCAKRPHSKILLVVPCSDPSHALETYAVMHGGWGAAPPSRPPSRIAPYLSAEARFSAVSVIRSVPATALSSSSPIPAQRRRSTAIGSAAVSGSGRPTARWAPVSISADDPPPTTSHNRSTSSRDALRAGRRPRLTSLDRMEP